MKRVGIVILVLLVLAAGSWLLFRERIVTAVARRVIEARMGADAAASLRSARAPLFIPCFSTLRISRSPNVDKNALSG